MSTSFVIVGLPASGKTTFLGALWHLIESGETNCRLKLERMEGDIAYLNKIAEAWRTFQEIPRTLQKFNIRLALRDGESGGVAKVLIPDLDGETFNDQVESRKCEPGYIAAYEKDDGILLFLSADANYESLSVVELNSILPLEAVEGAVVERTSQETQEWSPSKIPAQVRLAQILSDLMLPPFKRRQRRLAIVVSAWDVLMPTEVKPAQWLSNNLPLLDQFIRNNPAYFVTEVFGVSAQGCKLSDNEGVGRMLKKSPSDRIVVVTSTGESNDLTLPLVWLMSKDGKETK